MNEVTYEEDGKYAVFNNQRYVLRKDQGYFYKTQIIENKTKTTMLHRMVYIHHYGEIKNGYSIHHIDENKMNNEIENLVCMKNSEHRKFHGSLLTEKQKEKMRINLLENVVPKSVEWHSSEEGIKWHKEHYEEMKDKLHQTAEYICKWCGKKYIAQKANKNMFCSQNCRNKDRSARGVDNIKRICKVCGKEFDINKYKKQDCCSYSCANKIRRHRGEPKMEKL